MRLHNGVALLTSWKLVVVLLDLLASRTVKPLFSAKIWTSHVPSVPMELKHMIRKCIGICSFGLLILSPELLRHGIDMQVVDVLSDKDVLLFVNTLVSLP